MANKSLVITEAERKKVFSLFDQGETPGRVSMLLFNGHWYKAKKLHDEYLKQAVTALREFVGPEPVEQDPALENSEQESVVQDEAPVVERPEAFDPDDEDDGEPAVWDVTVQIPVSQMDRILSNFSPQEKADAIAAVLTARLSAED